MAKKTTRATHRPSRDTVEERTRRVHAQILQRAVRQQQRIRDLGRKLIRDQAAAERVLRDVVRMILDHHEQRSLAAHQQDDDRQLAFADAGLDPRD